MATPSTAEKRSETRRTIGLLAPAIAGPVASIWSASLIRQNSFQQKYRRVSGDSEHSQGQSSVKFTLTKTEDAMDSVLPCVAEELFRTMRQNKFGNAARLNFRYAAQ